MLIAAVVTLLPSVDLMARSVMKIDTQSAENIRRGRGTINMMDNWTRDTFEFRNYFFQDDLGQLKYAVVTGKILDYRA
jgi:hypothetical protein